MSEETYGSVEIVTSGEQSTGLAGTNWTPESAEVMAYAVGGITDLESAEPKPNQHKRTPVAAWTGKDSLGEPVNIYLWREEPFEETAVALAIAVAIKQAEDTRNDDA